MAVSGVVTVAHPGRRPIVSLEQPLLRCGPGVFLQIGNGSRSAWVLTVVDGGGTADVGEPGLEPVDDSRWAVITAASGTPGLTWGEDGRITHVDVPELVRGPWRPADAGAGVVRTFEDACAEIARLHDLATPMTVSQAAAMVGLTQDRFTSEMVRERDVRGRDFRVPRHLWRDGRSPLYDPVQVREWDASRPRRTARKKAADSA